MGESQAEQQEVLRQNITTSLKIAQKKILDFVDTLSAENQVEFWKSESRGFRPPSQVFVDEFIPEREEYEGRILNDKSLPNLDVKFKGEFNEQLHEEQVVFYFGDQIQHPSTLITIADVLIARWNRIEAVEEAKRDTETLREEFEKVADRVARSQLKGPIQRLETTIEKIDELEKREEQTRKLIGQTKEYQDWRVLVSDVYDLKSQHVSRELFESEIKRLEQRIEDIKAIRLFSIRTVLEVSLAIFAAAMTILNALLVLGIIPTP